MSSTYGPSYTSRYVDLFIQAYSAVKRDFFILLGEIPFKDINSMSIEEKNFSLRVFLFITLKYLIKIFRNAEKIYY
jgi:hypothetical protein